MTVFIAGMSRSGSMWIYNVTRSLIQKANKVLLPVEIPPNEEALISEALTQQSNQDTFYCIKTHRPITPHLPHVKIIFTYRDVRESMVSFMRFTHCNFERGLQAAHGMMAITDFYFNEHKDNIIRLRYNDFVSDPIKCIEQIRQFLGLEVHMQDIQQIADLFSKKEVQKLVDSFHSIKVTDSGEMIDAKLYRDFAVLQNFDGSFKIYHKKTAYQTDHITGQGEKWKKVLTEDQKERLMDLARNWLTTYGFPI